MSLVSITVWLV